MAIESMGKCTNCSQEFTYWLIHNGFNDSAYAYCDRCGKTAILSAWSDKIPKDSPINLHEKINPDVEPFLSLCECGGKFTHDASPRCPHCCEELSPVKATTWLERNAPGTAKGWRWQQNWNGLYCIVIAGNKVADNWSNDI